MLYCMEYLEANFYSLEENLKPFGKDAYVSFDLPNQVELSTNYDSLKRIVEKLTKAAFSVCSILIPQCGLECQYSRPVSLHPSLRRSLRDRCLKVYPCATFFVEDNAPSGASPHQCPL